MPSTPPAATTSPDSMNNGSNAPSSMEIDPPPPPSTPDRGRRDKKHRQSTLDNDSTPSKKRCESLVPSENPDKEMDIDSETSPTEDSQYQKRLKIRDHNDPDGMDIDSTTETSAEDESPPKGNATPSKSYIRLNSVSTDDTIKIMSNENLLKEPVSVSKKVGNSLSFDSIKTLPKPVLIQRAREFRDKLKSMRKIKQFRVTQNVSEDDIKALPEAKARLAYIASLKARSMSVDRTGIDQLAPPPSSDASPPNETSTTPKSTIQYPPTEESTDVGRYTSSVTNNTSSGQAIPPINKPPNPVKTITQRFISIRTKWYCEYFKKPHVELVKDIIQIVREVDSGMHLILSASN